MSRHGAKNAAHAGAAELAAAMSRRAATANERAVRPESLHGEHKHRSDKAERLASVMAGAHPPDSHIA